MSENTLLVLAASRYQVPVIQTAKRLGYRVVTTDNVPSNPGHALADKWYSADTTDKEAVLDIARRERASGIIAACTDVAVPTAAYVAGQLGLRGVPLASAEVVCNKIAFRDFLRRHAFPVPKAYSIAHDFEAGEILFRRPWIMKPDQSSGCKGVFILRSRATFCQYLAETLRYSPASRGILEEYIDGFQGTCEGILERGEMAATFSLDRQTVEPPYVATCGHHVPSRLTLRLQKRLLSMLEEIWRTLGIRDGPFDCDFVATGEEIYILELSPRIGGNCISTLLKQATGYDIVEYSVRHACNDRTHVPEIIHTRPTAVILLGVSEGGHLVYDRTEAKALRQAEWVDSLSIDVDFGEPVLPFTNGRHRVGEALVFGKNRDDLDARVIEFRRRLNVRTVAGKSS